ncbi:hypothetical protein DOY81_008693, partial [Sarcophaga bullata]
TRIMIKNIFFSSDILILRSGHSHLIYEFKTQLSGLKLDYQIGNGDVDKLARSDTISGEAAPISTLNYYYKWQPLFTLILPRLPTLMK